MPLHRAGTFAFHSSVLPWHEPEPKQRPASSAEPAELRFDIQAAAPGAGPSYWAQRPVSKPQRMYQMVISSCSRRRESQDQCRGEQPRTLEVRLSLPARAKRR